MNKIDRIILLVLAAVSVIILISAWIGVGDRARNVLLFIIIGFVTLGYYVYRTKAQKQFFQQLKSDSKTGFENSWNPSEAREAIEEWSEKEFAISDKIQFRWNDAEFDQDVVTNLNGEREKLYAFWTSFGEAHNRVMVYVNATSKDVGPYRIIKPRERVRHPFSKWSYWKTCKANMRRTVKMQDEQGDSGSQAAQFYIGAGNGVPGSNPSKGRVEDQNEG